MLAGDPPTLTVLFYRYMLPITCASSRYASAVRLAWPIAEKPKEQQNQNTALASSRTRSDAMILNGSRGAGSIDRTDPAAERAGASNAPTSASWRCPRTAWRSLVSKSSGLKSSHTAIAASVDNKDKPSSAQPTASHLFPLHRFPILESNHDPGRDRPPAPGRRGEGWAGS